MAKTKKNLIPCPPEKNKRKKKNEVAQEIDPPSEDDWVVVKKQRVTILIPRLPTKLRCDMPNVQDLQPPEQLGKANSESQDTAVKSQSHCSPRISPSEQPQSAGEPQKSMLLLPPEETILLPPEETILLPPEETNLLPPGETFLLTPEDTIPPTETFHHHGPNDISKERKSLSVGVASDDAPPHNVGDGNRVDANVGAAKVRKQTMMFVDTNAFMDQRMRATHLDKKLKRAGGLENWLVSLGLSCFTEIFQRNRVHKFHLARLTMEKLKDMGMDPVGPRRKLIHAIDCLCEPHCFQHM